MTKIIEMYRTCQYSSWEDAGNGGGIYNSVIHHDEAVEDVLDAVYTACNMMDGGYRIETRVRDEYPDEFKKFYDAFNRCFAYNIPLHRAYEHVYCDTACSEGTATRDAWEMWQMARGLT